VHQQANVCDRASDEMEPLRHNVHNVDVDSDPDELTGDELHQYALRHYVHHVNVIIVRSDQPTAAWTPNVNGPSSTLAGASQSIKR